MIASLLSIIQKMGYLICIRACNYINETSYLVIVFQFQFIEHQCIKHHVIIKGWKPLKSFIFLHRSTQPLTFPQVNTLLSMLRSVQKRPTQSESFCPSINKKTKSHPEARSCNEPDSLWITWRCLISIR